MPKHAQTLPAELPALRACEAIANSALRLPGVPQQSQIGQIDQFDQRLSTILESHDHPHVSIIGSHQAKKANLEMLKWQKCDCHDCEIPTEIGSVLTTTGSCLLIRKFRNRDQLASTSSCGCFNGCFNLSETQGDVGMWATGPQTGDGFWHVTWHVTWPIPISDDIWAFPFRHGGAPGTIIHLNEIFHYKPSSYWGIPISGNPLRIQHIPHTAQRLRLPNCSSLNPDIRSTIRFPWVGTAQLSHMEKILGVQTNQTLLKTWCFPKSAQNLPNHSLIYIYYYLFTYFITHKSSNLSEWMAENPLFMVVFPSQNLHFLGFFHLWFSEGPISIPSPVRSQSMPRWTLDHSADVAPRPRWSRGKRDAIEPNLATSEIGLLWNGFDKGERCVIVFTAFKYVWNNIKISYKSINFKNEPWIAGGCHLRPCVRDATPCAFHLGRW